MTDSFRINIAKKDDAARLCNYIYKEVGKKHIYAIDQQFFLYEFANDSRLNILVAENTRDSGIYGIYAYYIYSKVDDVYDLAGGISRVSSNCKIPMIGTMLYEKLKEVYNVRTIVSVGMNRDTSYEINRRRKDTYMGSLSQFYMLSGKRDCKIAHITNEIIPEIVERSQYSLVLYKDAGQMYESFDDERFKDRLPYKDRKYIEHRYFNHPIYRYEMLGLENDLVLVCREVEANGKKAFRIVDLLGDVTKIRHAGNRLREIMLERDYEYIDFMEFGMNEEDILDAGFTKLDLNGPNIIPNYFEPFEQRNIEVLCCASLRPALIFKADADQDRPSIVR